MNTDREWYTVVRYTPRDDWFGEQVDAFFVACASEALSQVSLGPMKPGECLRGFWADNDAQRKKAAKLYEQRRRSDREFNMMMRSPAYDGDQDKYLRTWTS